MEWMMRSRSRRYEGRRWCSSVQIELHEFRSGDRVVTVRRNFHKAKRRVKRNRLAHRRQRIQAHLLKSSTARVGDDPLRQRAADRMASKLRADVEAFHFT